MMRRLKNNVGWLISVGLVLMTLTIFGPLELYLTNSSEFWFDFQVMLKISGIMTAVLGALLVIIGCCLPKKAKPFYGTILFIIAAACYIQGTYANADYGILDGTEIDWQQFATYGIIDTVAWVAAAAGVILLQVKKPEWMERVRRYGSVFLIFIMLISLVMIGVSADPSEGKKSDYYLSEEGLYDISAEENVIVFVLDAYDDAYFQTIYREDEQRYNEVFENFTYYDNAAVAAARTKAALPAILTGKSYPGTISYVEYIANEFNSDGLYTELKKAGYNVGIYTESVFIPDDVANLVDNQVSTGYKVSSYSELTKKYFDFTLFKYMPHIFKHNFLLYSGDFDAYKMGADAPAYVTDDAEFFEKMELSVLEDSNVFRVYHLFGAHAPYTLNEYAQEQDDRTDLRQQARGALYIVEQYMEQMKRLGVYDNATIIIMADHGEPNADFDSENAAHGILFVKEKGSKSDFQMKSTPVSYYDLHPTLLEAIGIDAGDSFDEIGEGDRERPYYYYGTENGQLCFTEYVINGNMADAESVRPTGRKLSPVVKREPYILGTPLTFGLNPSAAPYTLSGISATDPGVYSWTLGKTAEMCFDLVDIPSKDLYVYIDVMTIFDDLGSQPVSIRANGTKVYSGVVKKGTDIEFTIPHSLIDDLSLEMTIEMPCAVKPSSIPGAANDSRTLALALREMIITEADTVTEAVRDSRYSQYETVDEQIRVLFGENGNAEEHIVSGVSVDNSGIHAWTNGNRSEFVFDLASEPASDVTVTMDVMTTYDAQGLQQVQVFSNGIKCFDEIVSGGQTVQFTIPQETFINDTLLVTLNLPDAAAPADLNGGVGDVRKLALALTGVTVDYTAAVGVPGTEVSAEDIAEEGESAGGFSIVDIVAIPLTALMNICHSLLGNYILTIFVFTLLTKIILLPVSLWVHKSGITMVKITPELNRVKIKHFGDRDAIDDATQALYKREKYNPLASTMPMIVQIVMLLGVIGAVKNLLSGAESILTLVPSEAGGITYLMPLAAGLAALALGLAQNKLSPLQREQGKKEQWMSNGFSIAISLILGAFVSLGVGIYWIASNLLSIAQQLLLNVLIKPEKHIDYAALEDSKKELASLDSLSAEVSKEDKKREQEDYKKFFSVANKHLVIYSEKSGFYKYYKDVMDFMLKYSNVIIHYVTNDPKDQVFKLAEEQPRIRPYYISEKKLITLLMKMDADIVVMTCPDLDRFHLKRSYVRKDIEYVYMFHYPLSTHMVLNNGALDHYDTILCVGDFQFEEIRAAEKLYNLPEKKLISAGYGQLEQLYASYQKMDKIKRDKPKILIAPSWQLDNILDSCIDSLLEQLLGKGYELVIRPHPEYVKRYKPRMDAIVQKYSHHSDLTFELDFTSNNSLFDSDILISDWSGSAYEFSLVTLKPAVFINTPPKINNPEYAKLNVEPLEFKLRGEVGIQIDPDNMEDLAEKINALVNSSDVYAEKIRQIRDKYMANFGQSGEVGGKYILGQLLERQNKK